jgi:hypothetical protein
MSIAVITNNYIENTTTSYSYLDAGIDTRDQSIHYVDDTILSDNLISNPFYVGFNGGTLKKVDRKVMYEFKDVVVLISNGLTEEFMTKFFSRTINLKDFECFPPNIVYYTRVQRNILKNSQHYFAANIVTDNDMKLLFPHETFNSSEIVLNLFELNRSDAEKYVSFYQIETPIEEIKYTLDLIKNYNHNDSIHLKQSVSRFLTDLTDKDFWSKQQNCKLNITNMFTVRDFQSRTDSNFILLAQCPDREKLATPTGDGNYPVNNNRNSTAFCDISSILRENKNNSRTFYASVPDNIFTEKNMLDTLKSTHNEKQLYDLTNSILLSKEFAHQLFTKDCLQFLSKLFDKYPGAYKYSLGYAMLTMYLEECLFLTKSNKNSRFVFDINTANKLPSFPFIATDYKQNPYVSIMIHNEQLDMKVNCGGIKCIQNYDGYGVCDLETFKKRMNIFISGNADADIFEGINWSEFAVSGSIIPACLQKRNPLYDSYCNEFKDENEAFKHFVANYYNNSDIDVMCNTESYIDYINKAYGLYQQIIVNTKSEKSDYDFDSVRTVGVSLSKEFFEESNQEFNSIYGVNWTTEEYVTNAKDIRVRMYLHSKYYNLKNKLNSAMFRTGKYIQNEFIDLFMNPLSIDQLTIYYAQNESHDFETKLKETDFIFYRNDFRKDSDKVPDSDNKAIMRIGESIRFKLNFKKINKTIEVFKTNRNDFFSTVARFHLPCVRAYYHDSNVYMLPSCVGAMMTGINIDYKYFAGIRDPYQIVIKYMKRGFGVLLNKDELKQLEKHITTNGLSKQYFGPKEVYSEMFTQFENKKEYKYIETYDELNKYYYEKNNKMDCDKFNTVAPNGNISPYVKSFFDFYYETSK